MFCPALTDGSIGDMLYLHTFKNPGLIIDIVQDIRKINSMTVFAKRTGAIILGGGIVKHHICNANLMRNGANHAVYINTAQEVRWLYSLLTDANGLFSLTDLTPELVPMKPCLGARSAWTQSL